MEYWRLLAHNHWYTLNLLGHKLRLCARCSGYLLGFLSIFLYSKIVGFYSFKYLGINVKLVLSVLLLLPLAIDWITQAWGYRKSNNKVRLITGFLLGIGIYLFSTINNNQLDRNQIILTTALGLTVLGLAGKLHVSSSER